MAVAVVEMKAGRIVEIDCDFDQAQPEPAHIEKDILLGLAGIAVMW